MIDITSLVDYHQLGRLSPAWSTITSLVDDHQLGRLVSESAFEREDPGSNPAADMVDAARNTAWDLDTPKVKAAPVRLEELCKQTRFTKHEIRVMYRGFKQECPEGVVQEDAFKEVYAKFFPHGNSSLYAHHVFKAFDLSSNGQISFRDLLISLSQLLKGSNHDKLKFAFKMYDTNADGCITKGELMDIVSSVHELMGRGAHHNRHIISGVPQLLHRVVQEQNFYVPSSERPIEAPSPSHSFGAKPKKKYWPQRASEDDPQRTAPPSSAPLPPSKLQLLDPTNLLQDPHANVERDPSSSMMTTLSMSPSTLTDTQTASTSSGLHHHHHPHQSQHYRHHSASVCKPYTVSLFNISLSYCWLCKVAHLSRFIHRVLH
ncbi:EF-hand domain [Trinorchestia longiramus]|nr:EF-hand domain [Trinorchestia longiramus]